MNPQVWELVRQASTVVIVAFIFSGMFMYMCRTWDKDRPKALRWTFRWCKRLFWIAVVVQTVAEVAINGPLDWSDLLRLFIDWFNWQQLKGEDDDDYWKRQRDKVTGVVKSLGHRLVVAPAGA